MPPNRPFLGNDEQETFRHHPRMSNFLGSSPTFDNDTVPASREPSAAEYLAERSAEG
jgi:hypothetical protein